MITVKSLVRNQKERDQQNIKEEMQIGFLQAIKEVGGADHWEAFSDKTFDDLLDICVRNGIYVGFTPIKEVNR